jgi:hypothetical protein
MLLPDFPIEFWSVRIFEVVANSVGSFVFFDEKSLHWNNKRLMWVLVDLDLSKGLPELSTSPLGTHIFASQLIFGGNLSDAILVGKLDILWHNCPRFQGAQL